MNTRNTPVQVAECEASLANYLGFFDKTLEFVEHVAEPQPAWSYVVKDINFPVEVLIRQTEDSFSTNQPQYRLRAWGEIGGELGMWFKGREGWVNRLTSLGALLVDEDNSRFACQFLLSNKDLDVCTALLAAAIVHGADSLVQSVGRVISKQIEPETLKVISHWSDLDFEEIQYDWAHLGVSRQGHGFWRMDTQHGGVNLNAVHDNPYWQGGLLVLNSVDKAKLGISGQAPINEMNAFEQLVSDVPVFGGWCDAGENVTFVSFIPNFAKEISNLTTHLVSWSRDRLAWTPELVKWSLQISEKAETD